MDNDRYDISALRKPTTDGPSLVLQDPHRYTLAPEMAKLQSSAPNHDPRYMQRPPESEDVDDFIHRRLREADEDPSSPPFDTIMEFCDEGAGSLAGSLSSMSSCARDFDQNFDELRDWGPRFSKLADMYGDGVDSSDEDDQQRFQASSRGNSEPESEQRSIHSLARNRSPSNNNVYVY